MGRFSRQFSRQFSRRFAWRWWPRSKNNSRDEAELSSKPFDGGDRRQLLQALSAMVGGSALSAMSQPAEAKDASELPPPKRALTGRDEAGKSVFKSFDVTPMVAEIDSNPGLTFYELYMTEGVPGLTGLEPDPNPCRRNLVAQVLGHAFGNRRPTGWIAGFKSTAYVEISDLARLREYEATAAASAVASNVLAHTS